MNLTIPLPIDYSKLHNFDLYQEPKVVHQADSEESGTFALRDNRREFFGNSIAEKVYTNLELKNEFALLINEIYKANPSNVQLYTPLFSSLNKTFDKVEFSFADAKSIRDSLFYSLLSKFKDNPKIYSKIISLNAKLNKVMSQNSNKQNFINPKNYNISQINFATSGPTPSIPKPARNL
jgi:hypothetical protein